MSVLLAGLDAELAATVAERLLAQGDQVRVIAPAGDPAPYTGAHVALGDPGDEDLVERATQGVRTIVLGPLPPETRGAALAAAARAGVGRAVLLGGRVEDVPPAMSCVVISVRGPRLLGRRRSPGADDLAEAIDAADDLAGQPRLTVDVATEEGRRALRLGPPNGS